MQYTGLNQNGIITVCMVGAGIFSITSISVIDKFLEKWQSWGKAAISIQNSVLLHGWSCRYDKCYDIVFDSGLFNYHWSIGLLQVGLYI